MRRRVDPSFGTAEELWRRIETDDVGKTDGTLKPQRLRLQVSTVRQRYGEVGHVTHGKWNGIATTTAGSVACLNADALGVVCVDEPTDEEPGHALIALVAAPGNDVAQESINALRAKVAKTFSVTQDPK